MVNLFPGGPRQSIVAVKAFEKAGGIVYSQVPTSKNGVREFCSRVQEL